MINKQAMNRRAFMKKSSYLAMSSTLSCASVRPPQRQYKLGYQLYSVRDAMALDPLKTLQSLKKMGYRDFELYGFDDVAGTYYGYEAREFKDVMDDLELTVSSGHYSFSPYLEQSDEALLRYIDKCIIAAKEIRSQYITWPWISPELRTIEYFKLMTQKLNLLGERVNAAGLGFAYHNHGYEFKDLDGDNGYDIILRDTDPALVKLQIDMYWVMHSSFFSPSELIAKQPGRFVMWHIKDMDKVTRDYTELGNGSIDYVKLLPDPAVSGLEYYYIEQGGNYTTNSMISAAHSVTYFKDKLQQFL